MKAHKDPYADIRRKMAKLAALPTPKAGSKRQPFPNRRPRIEITPSRAKPFAVDCREDRWSFIVPDVGQHVWWAAYDDRDGVWTVTSVSLSMAARPARIHDVMGVEIIAHEWEPDTGWSDNTDSRRYTGLTPEAVLSLGELHTGCGDPYDPTRTLHTFHDPLMADDWQDLRRIEDRGRFILQTDGSYRLRRRKAPKDCADIGAGVWRVQIGGRRFTCLRVIDECDDEDTLMEVFLTRRGRTVLCRRYNERLWECDNPAVWRKWMGCEPRPWDEQLPDHARIVIDGRVYVHWYDCLTGLALGIK